MISVIIPYFNNSESIERTLVSVKKQSYTDYEVIIVDDASSDNHVLKEIIEKQNSSNITLLVHEENKNGSCARNTGMHAAKGDYITFLDADDEWYEDHLSHYIKFLENNPELPERFCLYCRSIIKTSDFADLEMPSVSICSDETIAENLFLNEGFIQSSALFIPNLKDVFWNEKLIRHQDYDFLFRLEASGYQFFMSEHVGVTIHWEGNDITKKGGTWEYSLNYATEHAHYFSAKTKGNFIFKNSVIPLLKQKKRIKALKLLIMKVGIFNLSLKRLFTFADSFVFGKPRLLMALAKLKSR